MASVMCKKLCLACWTISWPLSTSGTRKPALSTKREPLRPIKSLIYLWILRTFTAIGANWVESAHAFLNIILSGKSRSFTGLFYFQRKLDPGMLFEKTLLNWQARRNIRARWPSNSSLVSTWRPHAILSSSTFPFAWQKAFLTLCRR
jgi:hypothetical protein